MEKCKKIKINNNFTLYEHRDDVNEYRYRQKDNLSHLRRIPKALFLNERVCEIIQPPEFNNRFKYKKSESMVLQSLWCETNTREVKNQKICLEQILWRSQNPNWFQSSKKRFRFMFNNQKKNENM